MDPLPPPLPISVAFPSSTSTVTVAAAAADASRRRSHLPPLLPTSFACRTVAEPATAPPPPPARLPPQLSPPHPVVSSFVSFSTTIQSAASTQALCMEAQQGNGRSLTAKRKSSMAKRQNAAPAKQLRSPITPIVGSPGIRILMSSPSTA